MKVREEVGLDRRALEPAKCRHRHTHQHSVIEFGVGNRQRLRRDKLAASPEAVNQNSPFQSLNLVGRPRLVHDFLV